MCVLRTYHNVASALVCHPFNVDHSKNTPRRKKTKGYCTSYYHSLSCPPTLCSMSFNTDHSKALRKKTTTEETMCSVFGWGCKPYPIPPSPPSVTLKGPPARPSVGLGTPYSPIPIEPQHRPPGNIIGINREYSRKKELVRSFVYTDNHCVESGYTTLGMNVRTVWAPYQCPDDPFPSRMVLCTLL